MPVTHFVILLAGSLRQRLQAVPKVEKGTRKAPIPRLIAPRSLYEFGWPILRAIARSTRVETVSFIERNLIR